LIRGLCLTTSALTLGWQGETLVNFLCRWLWKRCRNLYLAFFTEHVVGISHNENFGIRKFKFWVSCGCFSAESQDS